MTNMKVEGQTRSGKWTGNLAVVSCSVVICSRNWVDLMSSFFYQYEEVDLCRRVWNAGFGSALLRRCRSRTRAVNRSAVFLCGLRSRFAETDTATSTNIMEAKGLSRYRDDLAHKIPHPPSWIRIAQSVATKRSCERSPGNVSCYVCAGTNNSIRSNLCNTEPSSSVEQGTRCKRVILNDYSTS